MIQSLHYSLHEVVGYINWSYFFHAWGFPARFAAIAQVHGCDSCRAQWLASFPEADRMRAAEAMQLHKEALRMLTFLDQQGHRVHFRFGLFDCNSEGEDIVIGRLGAAQCTLSFLRQQAPPFLCLVDFIRPVNSAGEPDRIGVFCAAADEAIEHSSVARQDMSRILNAKGALEERFYEVAPSAEDDNHQSKTCPLDGRELKLVDAILFCEIPYANGCSHHEDASAYAAFPGFSRRDAREELVLAQQGSANVCTGIVDP